MKSSPDNDLQTQTDSQHGIQPNSPPTEQVFDLLLQGHGILAVREHCREQYPELEPDKLISEAFSIFSHLSCEPRDVIRGFVLTNAKGLFMSNMTIGDFKAAQDCLKLLLKMSENQPEVVEEADSENPS